MNNRTFSILAFLAAIVVIVAVFYLNSGGKPEVPAEVTAPSVTAPKINVAPTAPPVASIKTTNADAESWPADTAKPKPELTENKTPEPMKDWEVKIDQVLRLENISTDQTAQMLINLLPSLPADGQTDAAQHITNLLDDKDYSKVLSIVKNPAMSQDVLDVFVTDLMNREDTVKLPTLLEIAKIPNHPHHEEALSDLEIFLDGDHGNDWNKWDTAVKKYLKEQADEAEAGDNIPAPASGAPGNP